MRYLTKEWYLKCQIYPKARELAEQLKHTEKLYRDARDREGLPASLRGIFLFHDGVISNIEAGADCVMEIDSPYSQYRGLRFCNALIKQELPPVGAVWLYEELYRHKSGVGYEVHILCCKMRMPKYKRVLVSDLFETKIICEDIVLA